MRCGCGEIGKRCERRRWRMKRAERVAAVEISRANSEQEISGTATGRLIGFLYAANHPCKCKTEYADVVELVDSLDLGSNARACRFESCHPHQKKSTLRDAFLFAESRSIMVGRAAFSPPFLRWDCGGLRASRPTGS